MKFNSGRLTEGAAMKDGKPTKQGHYSSGDASGWRRGQKGFGAGSKDDGTFTKTKTEAYGQYGFSKGAGNVGQFPSGKLKDTFKGYRGTN
jgi:hypothetical protein